MGKYGYNENVGTQHVRLVTKGDTMANKKVKVYTYKIYLDAGRWILIGCAERPYGEVCGIQ